MAMRKMAKLRTSAEIERELNKLVADKRIHAKKKIGKACKCATVRMDNGTLRECGGALKIVRIPRPFSFSDTMISGGHPKSTNHGLCIL